MVNFSGYQFRMATPGRDEPVIARLKVACWREAYRRMLPDELLDELSVERSAQEWRLALERGIAWIAERDNEPVAFGHLRRDEITTLYVRRPHWGRGIGRELLGKLFDEVAILAPGRRTFEAHLWVLEENDPARRFYASMGGEPIAKRSVGFRRWPEIMEVRYDFDLTPRL